MIIVLVTGLFCLKQRVTNRGFVLKKPHHDNTVFMCTSPAELTGASQKGVHLGPLYGLSQGQVFFLNSWPTSGMRRQHCHASCCDIDFFIAMLVDAYNKVVGKFVAVISHGSKSKGGGITSSGLPS